MPTVNEVKASYNRKIQLDDFEPIQHGAEISLQVDDGDDWEDVYAEAAREVEEAVEAELARRVTNKKLGPDSEED